MTKVAFGGLVAALVAGFATVVFSQVPPHPPGTVCLTPYSWCWLGAAGAVGAPCSCGTDVGTVI